MDEATTAGAMGRVPIPADALALRGAAPDLLDAGLEMDEAKTAAGFRATGGRGRPHRGGQMDASAVSALLDTGFKMDEVSTAAAFLASRWWRRLQPAPCDASRPPRMPSLSVGPRRPCPPSLTQAPRWMRR